MSRIPFGTAGYRALPLIDAGAQDFLSTIPVIAAGDAKLRSEKYILTNPTAKILGFDSMSEIPRPGDVLSEDGGDGAATVIGVILVSGTVGTTGAGFMFVDSVSGTWSDNALIDNDTTGTADVATVDAGTTGVYTLATNQIANTPGLFGFANKRAYVAWTAAEASCRQLAIDLVDTATKEWEDTGAEFETEGHESAYDPQGCILTDTVNASGQSSTNIRLSGAPATAPKTGYYWEVVTGTGIGQAGYVKTYTAGATFDVVPYVALDVTLDDTSVVKFYRDAKRAPAHVVTAESGVLTLHTDYDAAKTASQAGDEMDFVAAPNATAITAIQAGLAVPADVLAGIATALFDDDADAQAAFQALAALAIVGTVGAGTSTSTRIIASDVTGLGNDRLIGRPLTFSSGTLAGTTVKITDYVSTTGLIDFTLITDAAAPAAPSENDTFVIH